MSTFKNCTLRSRNIESMLDYHLSHLEHSSTMPQSFPVVINGKLAGFPSGEKIQIHYGPHMKADIIYNSSVINKDLDVELEEGICCNSNGNYFGKNLGVAFDEKKGLIYIGKVKGLNGGAAYNKFKCYQRILEKLRDNKNPFVTKELNKFLDEASLINNEIIFPPMNNLPCDLQVCMKELFELLNTSSEPQHLLTTFNEITDNFKTLDVNIEYWDLLSMFLELNCVKQLSVSRCRKIIEYILKKAKEEDIFLLITQERGNRAEETLTEEKIFQEILEKINYFKEKYDEIGDDDDINEWDLLTLIKQILKTKPKQENGFMHHLNDDEKFFKNKLLIFQDHSTHEILLRDYITSFKKYNDNIQIELNSGSLNINVSVNYINVAMNAKEEVGLLACINQNRAINDILISHSSSFIDPGKYTVKIEKAKKSILKKLISIFSEGDEAELITLDSGSKCYKITLVTDRLTQNYKSIYIKKMNTKQKRIFFSERYFDSSEKALVDKNAYSYIPFSKVNQMLRIEDYEDNSQRKINQLKMIKQEREYIQRVLIKEHTLRKSIINDYLHSQLKTLSDDVMSLKELDSSQINHYLQIIIDRYRDEFEIEKNKKALLKSIALTANYQVFVTKEKSVEVEQAMKLLSASQVHLEALKYKSIIFLIGGTGSGKSTTACYLLGAKMKIEDSKFGEKIATVVSNEKDYPIIGQSLGTSETLYCKGYAFKGKYEERELVLCDCPGFHDTRGSEYELCTNLSIDKTVKNAKLIKSILLIIPYSAFILNRGKAIISEIGNLVDILPDILLDNSLLKSVFFLITKVDTERVDLSALKERTSQNIREINEQMRRNADNQKNSENHEYVLSIWKKVEYLLDINHIIIIDVNDARERAKIISNILKAPCIDKSKFNSTILSKEMMMEYGKLIEMSTHTWHKIIIPMFLRQIPHELSLISKKINDSCKKISEICVSEENILTRIEILKANLEAKSDKLRYLFNLIRGLESKEIQEDEINAFISSDEDSKDYESELKQKKNQLNEKFNQIETFNKKINLIQEEINSKNTDIKGYKLKNEKLNEKIKTLSAGSTQDCLYEYKKNPNDHLTYNTFNDSEKNRALSECRELVYEQTGIDGGLYKNFTGELYHHILLKKDYRIYPKENQDEFFKMNHEVVSNGKSYRAIIEGFNFKISGDPKGHIDGKMMIWPIETKWQGREDKIPWFKIVHLLPNMDRNEATIINLNAEVIAYINEISKLGHEVKILEKNITQEKHRIESFTKDYEIERKIYEEQKNAKLTGSLESIKNRINRDIQDIHLNINSSKNQLELNAIEKKELENQIEILKIKEEETLEKKKHLSLLILKQIRNAEILYEFCGSILCDNNSPSDCVADQTGVIKNCREFMSMFSENKLELETRAKFDIFPVSEEVQKTTEISIEEIKEESKNTKEDEGGKKLAEKVDIEAES